MKIIRAVVAAALALATAGIIQAATSSGAAAAGPTNTGDCLSCGWSPAD